MQAIYTFANSSNVLNTIHCFMQVGPLQEISTWNSFSVGHYHCSKHVYEVIDKNWFLRDFKYH